MEGNYTYYELRLMQYLMENHPMRITDKDFIRCRAEEAAASFEESSREGRGITEAGEIATAVLTDGLRFSPYRMVVGILEDEFPSVGEEERSEFAVQMLSAAGNLLEGYETARNDFGGSEEMRLYTEMTGFIRQYLEENGME